MSRRAARTATMIGLGGLLAAAGLGAAGCADLGRATGLAPEPIDPGSAVAADVRAATQAHYRLPGFRDVPPAPAAVRPPAAFKPLVAENEHARDRLEAWVAANPPMITVDPAATEAYAAAGRAMIPADQAVPVTAPAGSEEYAARLRALATPPPPPR